MVTLRFTYAGYDPAERRVAIESGSTTRIDLPVTIDPLPGTIRGRLIFPIGLNPTDFREQLTISLLLSDGITNRMGTHDDMGQFEFEALNPGQYRVRIGGDPFVSAGIPTAVSPGETVELPDTALRLQDAQRAHYETAIEGVARLQGVTDEAAHGGIFIESLESDAITTTRADGRFRMLVEPGEHTLRFSRAGYGAALKSLQATSPPAPR